MRSDNLVEAVHPRRPLLHIATSSPLLFLVTSSSIQTNKEESESYFVFAVYRTRAPSCRRRSSVVCAATTLAFRSRLQKCWECTHRIALELARTCVRLPSDGSDGALAF